VAVVQQAVEDGCRHDGIAEHRAPSPQGLAGFLIPLNQDATHFLV